MSRRLMCHVVAGYPDTDTCLKLMHGMYDAGVAAIEVQIPFSDPIADGETIMHANDVALANSMTIAGSFKLMSKAREQGTDSEIYVMSYLQKVRHFGFNKFCKQAVAASVQGLIIPDLPYDSPEFEQLRAAENDYTLKLVPVLSPGMRDDRLKALLDLRPERVYVTSQRGITGNSFTGSTELEQLIAEIRRQSKAEIMVGFGISTAKDATDALKLGDIAVVGSAIINQLQTSSLEETISYIEALVGNKS